MHRARLKALLETCPPSVLFDARARDAAAGEGDEAGRALPAFFEHALLKNVVVLKMVGRQTSGPIGGAVQTRLYVPFDPKRADNGGVSMTFDDELSLADIEKFTDSKVDPARIEADLQKLKLLARLPSFAPFLMRDAFERANLTVDLRHFKVSDVEANAMRDMLKAKLKPLAAMALALPANAVGDARLDLLARKLWELDDPNFLKAFGHALKIPEGQTLETLYAWIGVAFFQREFAKRQAKLRDLGVWLSQKREPQEMRNEFVRSLEADRGQLRDALRRAWTQAGQTFERYNKSYDALIADSDALPLVEYLQGARGDVISLGAQLALLEQCLGVYEVAARAGRGNPEAEELVRDLAASLRGPEIRAA